MLNRAKDYYENDKEILRLQARKNPETYLKKKNNKKREYGINRRHNMFEEEKKKTKRISKKLS